MTKVLRLIGKVSRINLPDPETEVMFGDEIGKRPKKASRSRGLERTLPICQGSQYPPGCTVLECQFEADRPVARIVQVPADTAATARNSCLLTGIKPSSNLFSRLTPRRTDVKQRVDSIDICSQKRTTDEFISLPATYTVKSVDYADDSVVLAGKLKIPVKTVPSAILKIGKDEKQRDDSSYKILRRLSSKNILKASYCDDKLAKRPVTRIECITTPKGPLTRVTRCSTRTTEGDGANYRIRLESKLKKDSSHKIIQPVTDSAKKMISDLKARVSSERALSERSVPCRKSKPEATYRSPGLARPGRADLKIDISLYPKMKDSPSQITRKNGDPDLSEIPSSLKKPSRYERRICPASLALGAKTSLIKKTSEDALFKPSSQEWLTRYKKYIPAYQWEKYEACRSKRNGLQDECVPPLLQAILRKKEQQRILDKCSKRKVDQLDQSGMRGSMKHSQTKIFLYVE